MNGLDPGYDGVYEERYTNLFVEYMGSNGFADAVSSGCAAIYIAIKSLGLPPNSIIATSPVTDASIIGCITEQGHIPYLLDSDPLSYNISVSSIIERYSPLVSAIVVTHAGGEPCEMDPIVDFCRSKGIHIIEDCSQAIGAIPKCSAKRVGSYGRFACFSTMYRKNLSASGSSGLIYSQDYADYRLAKQYADRGKKWWNKESADMRDPGFADFPGLNWNSDELRCAIGLANLKRLERTNKRRRAFVKRLIEEFKRQNIQMFSPYTFHEGFAPFYFPVIVNANPAKKSVVEVSKQLRDLGLGVGVKYGCLVSTWDWAKPFMFDDFSAPNALATRDSCFHLYLNENYGEREVDFIVGTLKSYESRA
jgi:dTDP-4-amino-4,6-dideoxygalactose transaminase